jgi:hypothetical protein
MNAASYQCLNMFLASHSDDPALKYLKTALDRNRVSAAGQDGLDEIIDIYLRALPVIEKTLWSAGVDADGLSGYQRTFRELEHFISLKGNDRRFSFIVVIPVADRPQHLTQCLNSLLILCNLFHYGGMQGGCFNKVSVLVADDSSDAGNIERIREACRHFTERGLGTEYFGAAGQKRLLQQTPHYTSGKLCRVLGNMEDPDGNAGFSHKGAAITRNITYLKLRQTVAERNGEKLLFYFVDSDQQFNVPAPAPGARENLYAINYFHHLDEIFSTSDAAVLTGKVVGDPPVSPAVMAGHFQDDVTGFLKALDALAPEKPCCFHNVVVHKDNEASYHDMANLFGFSNADDTFRYQCTLRGAHNHKDCINDFAGKLNGFFYGEHPTRATRFNYTGALSATAPARTVYTGNYIFRPDALKYFIPFAILNLRMAGPVLGRVLKSEIGHSFVSANLPMLHNRTVEKSGQSEFRTGVKERSNIVDLSGEFERQFYGDVMLFTIERLAADGYPHESFAEEEIINTVEATDKQLREQYATIHTHILRRLVLLKETFANENSWWNTIGGLDEAIAGFECFIDNIDHNFGENSECYELIDSAENRTLRLQQIASAVSSYPADMTAWQEVMP